MSPRPPRHRSQAPPDPPDIPAGAWMVFQTASNPDALVDGEVPVQQCHVCLALIPQVNYPGHREYHERRGDGH